MPTKVFWGEKCLVRSAELITGIGNKSMIITGRRSAQLSGALTDLLEALKKKNQDYYHFSEIEENPELMTIQEGAELLREFNCDHLIGIGGGSPIDAAKAISVMAANKLQGREIYEGDKIKYALPIVAIPTTSGTGTEVTPYSVISDRETRKKAGFGNPLIFPLMSFCDPEYTYSLPQKVTIDTALDALSHLLEGIYSRKRCDFLFPFIFSGIKLIIENLELVISNPQEYLYRENLMRASLYGGFVIAQAGTTLQHSIGYPLTTHYELSHGMANGVVMKEMMELYSSDISEDLNSLFSFLDLSQEQFYLWLDEWIPDTRLELPEDFIIKAAEEIMGSRNMAQNPREVSAEEVKSILRKL